jgi:molybdopterin-guanine dinucleotide biosynthesis protein
MMIPGGLNVHLISVAGACSRSGKTALAVTLLRALPTGAAAVKFTTTNDVFERCPRGTPCLVCDIRVPYRIVEDPRVLSEAGTDTARLGEAGARPVLWAIAKENAAASAWEKVRSRVSGAETVIMEGSTIVNLASPTLCLFVVHPFLAPERWKATSAALLERADAVVVNRPQAERRGPSRAVLAQLTRLRGKDDLREGDVTRPLAEWAPDLAERLRALAPAAPQHRTA